MIAKVGLAAVLLCLGCATPEPGGQELGRLWTFEDPPLERLEREIGFRPTRQWLEQLRLGTLRIGTGNDLSGTGSASFVSPRGLILTSTRCVYEAIAQTQPRDTELIKTGFVAKTPEEELRLKTRAAGWLQVAQLVQMADVTERAWQGVSPSDEPIHALRRRESNERKILERARQQTPEFTSEIVRLHGGSVVRLYQYRVYNDVRLVVLPHLQVALFGGTENSFRFPKTCLDFALLRAYDENGAALDSSGHYFSVREGELTRDELVFCTGSPGSTKRSWRATRWELERDLRIPMEIDELRAAIRIEKDPRVRTYSGEFDPENPSDYWAWVRTNLLKAEHALSVAHARISALRDPKRIAERHVTEEQLRRRIESDRVLDGELGALLARFDRWAKNAREIEAPARFYTTTGSGVLAIAVALVRSLDPDESNAQREAARKILQDRTLASANLNFNGLAAVADHVDRAHRWLPVDDPYRRTVLGGMNGWDFLDAIEGEKDSHGSWRWSKRIRETAQRGGWKAIQESDDAAIVAARALVPLLRTTEQLTEALLAEEASLSAELGQLLRRVHGHELASDGTDTPRFSDGRVAENALEESSFSRLFEIAARSENRYPFKLPTAWLEKQNAVDPSKRINFISTNDTTIESIGSALVNRDLELVGVVTEGVQVADVYQFREGVPRTVSTHVDGILEALRKVYNAEAIAEELTGA